jgi:hypothetical protein
MNLFKGTSGLSLLVGLQLANSNVMSVSASASRLAETFDNPPAAVRPITWWHWMNGNVTKEGITLDLEWMARIGLGGAQVFETSQVPLPGKAVHRSEYWQECIRHSIAESARLGLEFGMHNASGWNNSGGPWVEPEDSMKKLVFSRSLVSGPQSRPSAPPQPPAEPILPFELQNDMNARLQNYGLERTDYEPWIDDVAIFAFPAPEGAFPPLRDLQPEVEPFAAIEASTLWDGDETTGVPLDKARLAGEKKNAAITVRLDQPQTVRSVSLLSGEGGIPCRQIELLARQQDGTFSVVKTFSLPKNGGPLREKHAVSFAPVTSQEFRLRFLDLRDWRGRSPELRELDFYGDARIEAWPVKAGFLRGRGEEGTPNPQEVSDPGQAVALEKIIDLRGRLRPDGTLDWEVPEGQWTLLRVSATSTGKMNHPATIGGVGLEVDKFDKPALNRFIEEGPMQMVVDLAGELAGKTLKAFGTDSWEVGTQNWTPDMVSQFRQRRGYDPTLWLPVLSGQVVGTAELSERFLWDYRQTISDLFAEHFYGSFQAFCHQHGLHSFAEPYNNANFNNLQMGGFVDDVAPVFWTDGRRFTEGGIREMASIANTYGLARVESEAYTSMAGDAMWRLHPRKMKALGDAAFAYGVSRYVFHTSAHQPWVDTVPGMTMGPFGINFTRNTTWAEQAESWIRYITRCQAMLQSGRYAADALFFIGEGSPNGFAVDRSRLGVPEGYGYDGCDATILLEHASVEDGEIALKSGMRYRLLVLPDQFTMTLPVAEKIRDLVRDGASVLVQRIPQSTPGLTGLPDQDARLQAVMTELMGNLDGRRVKERAFGKGRLFMGYTPEQVFARIGLPPSYEVLAAPESATVRAIHRRDGKTDFFFVALESEQPGEVEIAFRVEDGQPELWNPYRQARKRAAHYRHEDGRTQVKIDFDPDDSVFVVFPKTSTTDETETVRRPASTGMEINGPWTVAFQPNRGAPESIKMDSLIDLTEHADEGVKYFSGTAAYRTTFRIEPETIHPYRAFDLDLGDVEVVAEVRLNGKNLGILWKRPYRIDIGGVLREGTNELEVKVTNLWPNRLIGDERQFPVKNNYWWAQSGEWPDWVIDPAKPNPSGRIGFVVWPHWTADDALLPSGLIGPVRLLAAP